MGSPARRGEKEGEERNEFKMAWDRHSCKESIGDSAPTVNFASDDDCVGVLLFAASSTRLLPSAPDAPIPYLIVDLRRCLAVLCGRSVGRSSTVDLHRSHASVCLLSFHQIAYLPSLEICCLVKASPELRSMLTTAAFVNVVPSMEALSFGFHFHLVCKVKVWSTPSW
jgi:hypothetical protein